MNHSVGSRLVTPSPKVVRSRTRAPGRSSDSGRSSAAQKTRASLPPPTVPLPRDELDLLDREILDVLLRDGRVANNRLANLVGVAPSTALTRLRSLVDRKVVTKFTASVDLASVGRPVQATVAVRLRAHDRREIREFWRRIEGLPEIVSAFHVAGADDYLIHVAVASAEALRDFVLDFLTTDPVVAHTETTLVFEHRDGYRGPLPARRPHAAGGR